MIDLAFAAGTGVVWIVLLAWYALHARHAGPFRSERVESVGGTVLVGANIMNATYWGLAPLVRMIVRIGITANMISWIALALGVAAGAAIGIGWFGLACALATASTLCRHPGRAGRVLRPRDVRRTRDECPWIRIIPICENAGRPRLCCGAVRRARAPMMYVPCA